MCEQRSCCSPSLFRVEIRTSGTRGLAARICSRAPHLGFDQDANCGLRRIVRFLELTQLDQVVGSSYGTQYIHGQIVSDPAKALLAHAAAQNAHHSPDLFHVQQELSRATALSLRRQTLGCATNSSFVDSS